MIQDRQAVTWNSRNAGDLWFSASEQVKTMKCGYPRNAGDLESYDLRSTICYELLYLCERYRGSYICCVLTC